MIRRADKARRTASGCEKTRLGRQVRRRTARGLDNIDLALLRGSIPVSAVVSWPVHATDAIKNETPPQPVACRSRPVAAYQRHGRGKHVTNSCSSSTAEPTAHEPIFVCTWCFVDLAIVSGTSPPSKAALLLLLPSRQFRDHSYA